MSTNSTSDDYGRAYCTERLGRLCELAHEYDKAIQAYEDVIRIYSQQIDQDLPELVRLHQKITTIYWKNLQNYPLAIQYHLKTHEYLSEKHKLKSSLLKRAGIQENNTRETIIIYVQLADIYLEMKDYALARENLNAALNFYGEDEQELQIDRQIIENIQKKLTNIPLD